MVHESAFNCFALRLFSLTGELFHEVHRIYYTCTHGDTRLRCHRSILCITVRFVLPHEPRAVAVAVAAHILVYGLPPQPTVHLGLVCTKRLSSIKYYALKHK